MALKNRIICWHDKDIVEIRKALAVLSGWIVYILLCADGTFYTGMARNMKKELATIRTLKKGYYFSTHPERFPIKTVYEEPYLCFREAYAKLMYLRIMNKKMKIRLMRKREWPVSGPYGAYLLEGSKRFYE